MRNLLLLACTLVVAAYLGSRWYLHDKVTRQLDMLIAAAQPMVDIRYEGVSSTLTGELGIDDVTMQFSGYSDPVHIDSVRIVTPGYFHLLGLAVRNGGGTRPDIPESLTVAVRGLEMPVRADYFATLDALPAGQAEPGAADPAAQCAGQRFTHDILRDLGYERLVIDASVGYRTGDGRLVIDVVNNVADMYDFALTLTFEGAAGAASLLPAVFQPRLVNGRAEYVDRSLEERVMRLCTEEWQVAPEAVIAARKDAFALAVSRMGIELDEYVMEPYVEFLRGKRRLVVTAQPIEPVNLKQVGLYKPSDVPALLNLSAEAL